MLLLKDDKYNTITQKQTAIEINVDLIYLYPHTQSLPAVHHDLIDLPGASGWWVLTLSLGNKLGDLHARMQTQLNIIGE